MKSEIELIAINYRDGCDGKTCQSCVYVTSKLATGYHCGYHDLPTRSGKWCSLGLLPLKQECYIPLSQKELF